MTFELRLKWWEGEHKGEVNLEMETLNAKAQKIARHVLYCKARKDHAGDTA